MTDPAKMTRHLINFQRLLDLWMRDEARSEKAHAVAAVIGMTLSWSGSDADIEAFRIVGEPRRWSCDEIEKLLRFAGALRAKPSEANCWNPWGG